MQATIVFEKNWQAIHAVNDDGSRRYKYIINIGSSRSSKTYSIIDCYDLYARSNTNKRLTAWRDTKTDCKKTVLNDTLKRLKSTGRYKHNQTFNKTESIFTYSTESTFEIHGTDDEETVHGLTQDAAWLNEPYSISRETFNQIDQRTSDFIIIDLNPKKGHWSDDLMKDPRTIIIQSTFKDNPFCPEESRLKILSYQPVTMCSACFHFMEKLKCHKEPAAVECRKYDFESNPEGLNDKTIKELLRCIENEGKNSASEFNWSVYGLGLKAEKPNRIFSWTKIPRSKYDLIESEEYFGNDWGKVDPWGIIGVKYLDGALYIRELNYLSENQLRERMTQGELISLNSEDESVNVGDAVSIVTWQYNRLGINRGSVVVCDSNRPAKIAYLRRGGWSQAMPAQKLKGSIIDGIELLCDLKVYYTDDSENLEFEQENYSYKVDNYGTVLDEPEDKDNHLIDPARYVAQYLRATGIIKLS